MRRLVLIVLLLAGTLVTAGCSSGSSLTGKTWQWAVLTSKTPTTQIDVPADQQANYTIEFKTDGTFASKIDCNQVSGRYTTTSGGAITIVPGPSTLAACPSGSLGSIFLAGLTAAASYKIDAGLLTITTAEEATLQFK